MSGLFRSNTGNGPVADAAEQAQHDMDLKIFDANAKNAEAAAIADKKNRLDAYTKSRNQQILDISSSQGRQSTVLSDAFNSMKSGPGSVL